ncbi:MAG: flagellar motor switch phosphatase FliY [Firmicutes bacterium]|nr:flagellar motor switch phosphatase FliY [Bacillota bacterium]
MAENEMKGNFSSLEIDAIGELMNISLGSSATAASKMLDRRVNITTPRVSVKNIDEFEFKNLEPALAVEITYVEGLDGNNLMILKKNDVRKILEILMMTEIEEEGFVLDELSRSAVCELMNQMMGSSATSLSEIMGETVNISTPIAFEVDNPDGFKEKYFDSDNPMVIVSFDLDIEDCLQSEFMMFMSIGLAKKLINAFGIDADMADNSNVAEAAPKAPAASEPVPAPTPAQPEVSDSAPIQETPAPAVQQAPPQPTVQQYTTANTMQPNVINVQNMTSQFNNMTKLSKAEEGNLDLIMSVPLQVSVEIGRTKKQVKEILTLSQGSLVVLDKLAGEQVDVFVNGQHVAKGDVVVIDDNFGVRITEIIKNPALILQGE